MQRQNLIKKGLFTFLLFLIFLNTEAQTGLNFQGVARTNNNVILASQQISLRLSILQGSASGTTEYTETRKVTTNAQGLFSVVIGDTDASSTIGNFSTINWKNTPKYLKIEMDAAAGNNFITMGTTQFQYVAYAQFASSVDADNIAGIVPIAKGGTGVTSLASLKAAIAIDKTSIGLSNVDNTTDLLKPISTATQTVLDIKANTSDVSNSLANKVDKINGKDLSSNDYTTAEKTKLAAITGTNTGDQDLSSYATTSALALKANASDLTTSLALKENASNKSSAADLGGVSPSDVLFPTQKAVKDYVTANASSGGVADGGITTIKLADGAVTDAKLGTGISKSKVGLSNVENVSISSWAGTSSLTTVGTITSGTWSGTAVAIEKGGTGLTSAGTAGQVLTSTGSGTLVWKSTTPLLSIGDVYQGGKVAYILQAGDPGYDATIQKGIIAASSDQSTGIRWYNGNYTPSTGAIGTAIGTGLSNTNSIITSQGAISTSYAAGLARAYAGGGYTDWYLPSKDELNKLYLNRTAIGGFADVYYWSSTEIFTTNAFLQDIGYGNQEHLGKDFTASVRAIRAFSAVKSIEDGGTGATTQQTAINAITGTQISGRYLRSDGTNATLSAIQIGDVPTLNQNTTGNAATATTAGNITATVNTTLTSLSNLARVGTITSGVWSGTTVAVEKGGTGATTQQTAINAITGTQISGRYLRSDGTNATLSAIQIGDVPTLNQNTTGNAATATTAGNITATSNTTLTTLSNLTSVGTLTSATVNGKVIVGASSAASASAVLEASSTTQGFLPPRLNYYQKTQITSPVAGLTIWCSNCGASGEMQVFNGAAWTNMSGGTATGTISLSIGQSYQGGIVAYILVSGDPGYDANTPHGLIAATSDQSTGIQWYNGSFRTTGATGTAIGTGLSNTNTIITSQGATATSYAAGLARAYTGGGYTDWYLPSKDELNKLYLNRSAIGGFDNIIYWSSTEIDGKYAWGHRFNDGQQGFYDKNYIVFYVRAIRSF